MYIGTNEVLLVALILIIENIQGILDQLFFNILLAYSSAVNRLMFAKACLKILSPGNLGIAPKRLSSSSTVIWSHNSFSISLV